MFTKENLLAIARQLATRVTMKFQEAHHQILSGALTGAIGAGGDETKIGDQLVEDILQTAIPAILKENSIENCLLISEETGQTHWGEIKPGHRGIFLLIDPVDGSRNMRPHYTPRPFVCFSVGIGLLEDLFADGSFGSIQAGVAKNIFYDEEFYATRNSGAYLNGEKINSSPVIDISEMTLGMSLDRQGDKLDKLFYERGAYDLLKQKKYFRRLGLTTLDLCRVATGDYDAHISVGSLVKMHDLGAVKLILEEAGGVINLYSQGELVTEKKWLLRLLQQGDAGIRELGFDALVASGNKELLDNILKIVKI